MLIRLPLAGGDPVCLDRGDFIADLISDGDGVVYLKTTSGASAIARAAGNQTETLYNFASRRSAASPMPTVASWCSSTARCIRSIPRRSSA